MTMPRNIDPVFLVSVSNKNQLVTLFCVGKKDPIPLLDELVPASYVSLEETVRQIAAQLRSDGQAPILTHQEFT